MPGIDFIAAIEREAEALGQTIGLGPHRLVARYPTWTVLDLVAHTGSVHRWVAGLVTSGATRPPARPAHRQREPDRLLEWFSGGVELVVDALRRTDPERPVWTMAADKTAGFWRRRMAHETGAHRWDAEDAVGAARPIDPQLAVTGIPETLEIHVARPLAGADVGGHGERIGLRCTDVRGDWTVTLLHDRVEVEPAERPADAAVAGSASAVWLSLMGRPAPDAAWTGREPALELFRRALRLADPPSF